MPTLSGSDLTALRSRKHRTAVYCSVATKPTLWTAQIQAPTGRGHLSINFEAGSGADWNALQPLQEVWVGTFPGGYDVGILRLRAAISSDGGVTGAIGAAPHALPLAGGMYLTFKHFYPLRPKFPKIEDDGEFKKDHDQPYWGDPNLNTHPVCIAGANRAGFRNETLGYFQINSQLPDSYATAPSASITGYAASCYPSTGVTISINGGDGTGYIRMTNPGEYWVKWSVTDSNGVTQDSFRWYYVHLDDKSSPHYPIVDFNVNSLNGDWESGGWSGGLQFFDSVPIANIPDETLCIVWQTPYYLINGEEVRYSPGFGEFKNALIVGYMRREEAASNLEDGGQKTNFAIETIHGLLNNIYMFSISLASRPNPETWYEYNSSLCVPLAIHHLWKWHSTLLEVADVFIGNNRDGRAFAEFEDGTLYSMPDQMARQAGHRAHVVADKTGKIHITEDVQLLTDSERAGLTVVASLEDEDKSGEVTIIRDIPNRTAFVKVSGFYFGGTFSNDTAYCSPEGAEFVQLPCPEVEPYCSSSPGLIPADTGPSVTFIERQVFRNQEHSDAIAGRYFAAINNHYPEVRVDFHGNYAASLEPAYPEFWTMTVQGADTNREIVWLNKNIILRSVNVIVDVETGTIRCTAMFEPESDGYPGVPGYCLDEIPVAPGLPGGHVLEAIMTASSVRYKDGSQWLSRSSLDALEVSRDLWWKQKMVSENPRYSIIYVLGSGFIRRSFNSFITNLNITPTPNPGALDYIEHEGNFIYGDVHTFLGRMGSAGDHESWLILTTDDAITYHWIDLV